MKFEMRKKRSIIIFCAIAICVAIVSLCSLIFVKNGDKESLLLPEANKGSEVASQVLPEVVIEDTTFSNSNSNDMTVQTFLNVKAKISDCEFENVQFVISDSDVTISNSSILNVTSGNAISVSGNRSSCSLTLVDTVVENVSDGYGVVVSGVAYYDDTEHTDVENMGSVILQGERTHIRNCSMGGVFLNEESEIYLGTRTASFSGSISGNGGYGIDCSYNNLDPNYHSQCRSVYMYGGSITDNDSGIYHDYGGLVELNGGTIHGNDHSGIYMTGNVSGRITISGGTISDNTYGIYAGSGSRFLNVFIKGGSINENKNAGIWMDNNPHATLNVSDGKIFGNGNHGIVTSVQTVVSGGEIFENDAIIGGGICVSKSSLQITGGKIYGNTSEKEGGGIFAYSSAQISITGGEITGNKATTNGGGVYVGSGINLSVAGGMISGNTGNENGGGIYSVSDNFVIGSGSQIVGNTAPNGGGVAILDGTLKMQGGVVSGNIATAYGGGVYVKNASIEHTGGKIGGDVTIGEDKVSGNTSGDAAGGVYINGGTYKLDGGTVQGNDARRAGGIFLNNSTIEISDGEIIENLANYAYGGGLYLYNKSKIAMTGGRIDSNIADTNGGGICVSGVCTFEISGGSVSNNNAHRGGALYFSSTSEAVICGTTMIENNTVTNNGGAIYNNSGTISLGTEQKEYTGKITGNTAKIYGGGIYNYSTIKHYSGTIGGKYTIDNTEYSGNNASTGGGVFVNDGTYELLGGSILENTAKETAGGFYLSNNSILSVTGGKVSTNTATNGYAGGIYVAGTSSVDFSGGEISHNNASAYGGGVYCTDDAVVSVSGGEVSHNYAGACGGGIYFIAKNDLNISGDTLILENQSMTGGGLYFAASGKVLTITDNAKIVGNVAYDRGGGVIVGTNSFAYIGTKENPGNDVVITGNTAKLGGGFFVHYGSLYQYGGMIGGSFTSNSKTYTENHSDESGGGVTLYSSRLFMYNDATISNNSATLNGGGVYAYSSSSFTFVGGVIENNRAAYGGGVYFLSSSSYFVNPTGHTFGEKAEYVDCQIRQNSATESGGGIYASAAVSVYGCDIVENVAGKQGGGIFASQNIALYGVDVKNNTASEDGGGIFAGGNVELSNSIRILEYDWITEDSEVLYFPSRIAGKITNISENIASTGSGGGIFSNGSVTCEGVIFDSNNAPNGNGGGIYVAKNISLYTGILFESLGYEGYSRYLYFDTNLTNNTCLLDGGAIYSESTITCLSSNNSKINFVGNIANVNGGAMYSFGGVSIGSAGKFEDNSGSSGGAIYSLGNVTIDHTSVFIIGNRAQTGGGIAVQNTTISMVNGQITGNESVSHGGGVHLTSSIFDFSGGTIGGNYSYSNNDNILVSYNGNISGAAGGGVYLNKSTLNLTGGNVAGNSALRAGGVYVYNKSHLNMQSGLIDSNMATDTYGGGVYFYSNSTGLMSGGSVTSNVSKSNGAGFYVTSNSSFEMSGGTIEANIGIKSTSNTRGGGIYVAGTFEMTGGTITKNQAASGGGINAVSGSTFNIYAGIISDNIAYRHGGGILCSTNLTLGREGASKTSVQITGNKLIGHLLDDGTEYVSGNGAAMAIASEAIVTINAAIISGNKTMSNTTNMIGAGLYLTDSSMVVMNGGEISGNIFEGVNNPVKRYNYETGEEYLHRYRGGAICLNAGTRFEMNGGIIKNSDAVEGGAIYVYSDGWLEAQGVSPIVMTGGTIENCRADYGGAICIDCELEESLTSPLETWSVNIKGEAEIRYCSAKYDGGAIFAGNVGVCISSDANETLDGYDFCTINTCTAGRNGGIVALVGDSYCTMNDANLINVSLRESNGDIDESLIDPELMARHNWIFSPCGTLVLAENGGLVSACGNSSVSVDFIDIWEIYGSDIPHIISSAVTGEGAFVWTENGNCYANIDFNTEVSNVTSGCEIEYLDIFYEFGAVEKVYLELNFVATDLENHETEEIIQIPFINMEEYMCDFCNGNYYIVPNYVEFDIYTYNNYLVFDDSDYYNYFGTFEYEIPFSFWEIVIDDNAYSQDEFEFDRVYYESSTLQVITIEIKQIECPDCGGWGIHECSDCNGSGNTGSCGECSGTGYCSSCDGDPECKECRGTGECWCLDAGNEDVCYDCDGSGECQNCDGYGYCYDCDGSGYCYNPDCTGGIIDCYCDDGYVECETCNGEGK